MGSEGQIKANGKAGRKANMDQTGREADGKANRGDGRWKRRRKKVVEKGKNANIERGAGTSNARGRNSDKTRDESNKRLT